jgi:hypothetical protein
MPAKRGRPLSGESDSAAVNHRREQVRERVRQHRLRQREIRSTGTQASVAQQEQSDHIFNLTTVEEEEAAATLVSLGMRKSPDLDIPHDPLDAQLLQSAEEIDEHNSLYQERRQDKNDGSGEMHTVMKGFFRKFARSRPHTLTPTRNHNDDEPSTTSAQPDIQHLHSNVSSPEHLRVLSGSRDPNSPIPGLRDDDPELVTGDTIGIEEEYPEEAEIEVIDIERRFSGVEIREDGEEIQLGTEDMLGWEQLSVRSEDEESEPGFVSEHEVDEEGEAASESTAEKLFQQLQGGHRGCSEERHEEKLREHMTAETNNHHGLGDIFKRRHFPSVLPHDEIMSPAQLQQVRLPSAAQWEEAFCGVPATGRQRLPMNVCLHKEQTQAIEPLVAFDIDSMLGFCSSLAAAKQGLSYQPAAQAQQNIQTDVHLETDAFQNLSENDETLRACRKMLRDVPHFLLGRLCGAHNITIHVLFPHLQLTAGRDRFKSMTEEQLTRWTDRIFHPALWKVFPAHYTQHLPSTYRVALANSKANQTEARKIETSSYQAQQGIAYHLQPEYLREVWDIVLETVGNTPGLADFREPQLLCNAKGTKLIFQGPSSRPTLLDVMEHYESYLHPILDMRFVEQDRFYVDIGKEICPSVSLLPGEHRHVGEEAQVYSWKRCCLEEYMQWMYDGKPPSSRAEGQRYYHQNMLYEASCLTSVTPKKSALRQGGLIYSQFYGSVKEMTDAAKCKPFDNDALEEMALDPQLRRGLRNLSGGHRREARIVELAYRASKRRARAAILDSRKRSFGIREEHRVTWSLFQRLKALLEVEDRESLEVTMTDCPRYAWPVRTRTYLDFLWRGVDKYATGFEIVHAQSRTTMVTWEQTKMMFAFLRCLRFVIGGHQLEPESAMWASKRTLGEAPQQRNWYGLGFCNTLPRYKYCWLEPRIDWQRLCFKPDVTNSMLFGNGVLRGQTIRRGARLAAFFDTAVALERGLMWIERNRESEAIREEVLSWMVHVCLKQLRLDVLNAVKTEIKEEKREEAMKGERPFCYGYFDEIMTDGCYLLSGNRCDFKVPSDLAAFLLNDGDGLTRQHWEDKPFRKLYQRARIGLRMQGDELVDKFTRRYWRGLFKYHWVLPYPCGNALLQTSKGEGRRMWYSIKQDEEKKTWIWGRKKWEEGWPSRFPRLAEREEGEWEGWIRERGGVVGAEE